MTILKKIRLLLLSGQIFPSVPPVQSRRIGEKEIGESVSVLSALITSGKSEEIKNKFLDVSPSWRKKVLRTLKNEKIKELEEILK